MDSYIENSGYHPQYHYFEKWLLFDTAIWFSKNTYPVEDLSILSCGSPRNSYFSKETAS